MANLSSPMTTYSDTTPQKKVITDVISLIDPHDTPMIEGLGGLDGASSKFKFINKGTNPQWLEDTLTPLSSTLNNAATITSTATTAKVTDPNMFQEGHIALIDAEQVWISAVVTATSIITVTRNFGGTQASHDSIAAITIIGLARLEGDDSDDLGFTDRTTGSNYTQIFHQEIKVSMTQQAISQWGITDEFDYQAKKAIPSIMRLVERALAYGQRKAGSASTPRAMGGFDTFITDNVVDYGAALQQTNFETAVKSAYEDGGIGPWIGGCSPTNLNTIKAFYDSSNYLRVDPSQSQVGMVIDEIVTPFGNVKLLLDRWMIDSKLPLVDPKHAGFLTLRPFTQEPLAKTGDALKGQVIGEITFCLRQDKAHALLTT